MSSTGPFGITHRFQRLFRSEGYVGYVLLTLSPLYSPEGFRARLACLIHTASVRSEPGSNPSVELIWLCYLEPSHARGEPRRAGHARTQIQESPCFQRALSPPLVRGGAHTPALKGQVLSGCDRSRSVRLRPTRRWSRRRAERGAVCRRSAWRRVEEGDDRDPALAVNGLALISARRGTLFA